MGQMSRIGGHGLARMMVFIMDWCESAQEQVRLLDETISELESKEWYTKTGRPALSAAKSQTSIESKVSTHSSRVASLVSSRKFTSCFLSSRIRTPPICA